MTQPTSQCRQCGYPLGSGERVMGLCPRCLLARIVEVRREVQAQMQRVRPWPDAPDPAVLSRALPSLEVLELIGRGGMGLVYKARQKSLERDVALKILPAERASEAAVVSRFLDEAKILGSLKHPNIVLALDAGQVDDWFYLVMELVPGPNLREILRNSGRLKMPQVLAIAEQLSSALAYAHSRNVVHRDIKPENILLEPGSAPAAGDLAGFFPAGGKVRVADFGIARLLETTEMTITAPQQVVGTLDYIAPECRRGSADAGPAADVYAAGVVLYEMLTGRLPVGNFPSPGKLANVSGRIDQVIMKALRSDPQERYVDGAALHRALVRATTKRWKPALLGTLSAVAAGVVVLAATGVFYTPELPKSGWVERRAASAPAASQVEAAKDVRVLMPGDSVKALWQGQWLDGVVVQREGRRVKVHYEGWSETTDEWVGADRLKW